MRDEAVIRVTRDRGGGRDFFRAYTVVVDGESVGKLRRGASIEIAVSAGDHKLRMKIDWEESGEWGVTLAKGETAEFICRPGAGAPFGSAEYYIDLHPAHP